MAHYLRYSSFLKYLLTKKIQQFPQNLCFKKKIEIKYVYVSWATLKCEISIGSFWL